MRVDMVTCYHTAEGLLQNKGMGSTLGNELSDMRRTQPPPAKLPLRVTVTSNLIICKEKAGTTSYRPVQKQVNL